MNGHKSLIRNILSAHCKVSNLCKTLRFKDLQQSVRAPAFRLVR